MMGMRTAIVAAVLLLPPIAVPAEATDPAPGTVTGEARGPAVAVPEPVSPADAVTAGAAQTAMAVWVEKKINFPYMAFTAFYSCDGLESKVRSILKEIGVRPGFKLTARGCIHLVGPERMPSLDIVAAMPREATPEVLADIEKDAAKRELVARYGENEAAAAEATAQFPARTRRIDFRDSPTGLVQPGDCELIEQLRDRVFVPLGAKVLVDRMACTPRQLSYGIINLSIEVLEPVPQP